MRHVLYPRTSGCSIRRVALLLPLLVACQSVASAPVTPTEPQAAISAIVPTNPPATVAPEAPTPAAEAATVAPATADATTKPTEARVSPVGETLRIVLYEPTILDPQKMADVGDVAYANLNYLPLMTFDRSTLKPIPGAAESYTLSDDGLVFTFKLRPNQTYSDGEPLTAENFEYAWKRLCDPVVAGDYASIAFPIVGCEEYYTAFETSGLSTTDTTKLQELRDTVGVNALDENTLEIKLKEVAPYFLNVTALWVGMPVRQDIIEANDENWWLDPANYIGNGPFQLTDFEQQSRAQFKRNANYVLADNRPQFDIEGQIISDENAAFTAYMNDELDILYFGADDLDTIEADPELTAERTDAVGACTGYYGFNMSRPPFDSKAVRQAFSQALDRDAYIRDIGNNQSLKALSLIPPGMPGHDDEAKWDFDAAAAKQRLIDSGYDMSQELVLSYAASPRSQTRNEYIAAQFQNVLGVKD